MVGIQSIGTMEKLLKVEELGEIIQVSPSTIYHWTQAEFIPHYKLPKGVRFKVSEVERWLLKKAIRGRINYRIKVDL